jgi:hypothetical protein
MPLINYIGNRQECLDNKRGGRGNAPAPIFLDYLLVGGGQYGNDIAGGGGGVVSGSIRFLPRFTLDVIVGDGGTGSIEKNAEPSIVQSTPNQFFIYAGPGGGNGSSGEPQNNPKGLNSGIYSAGGAGGSARSGSDGFNNQGGNGGSGSVWALDNNTTSSYGGGAGGYGKWFIADEARGGTGAYGAGNGQGYTTAATNGFANLGGGGGGTLATPTNGGSGIVKMRYISGSVMGAIGGTISVSGSYVYHTFTSSSQFIYQP